MISHSPTNGKYHRYHIDTAEAPEIVPWPSRFKVNVSRPKLAKYLITEIIHYRGDKEIILSRPCMYGVFSGPVGGFAPRENLCVGCLRCTTEFPDMVEIRLNPDRARLGDSYFITAYVNAVAYEAQTGRIPVKGAGYRGRFGGEGWDGMWTDMSEIVRPTRDGIHGREFISTSVTIGAKTPFLTFDPNGTPTGETPRTFSLPVPFIFDVPAEAYPSQKVAKIMGQTARQVGSLAVMPYSAMRDHDVSGPHIVPLVNAADQEALNALPAASWLLELDGWDPRFFQWLTVRFPETLVGVRTPFLESDRLLDIYRAGVRVFHLTADYHGQGRDGLFVHDLIRAAHGAFVAAGVRDEVTLIGSGGIIAAEHIPKAIIAGLDLVALDTAPLVALQAEFNGDIRTRAQDGFRLPENLTVPWGVQRLKNLSAAWRDQLLEVLGAMGLREVRRLRGETGRVMYMVELEREAFSEIEGYDV
jgi:hypothetical protein